MKIYIYIILIIISFTSIGCSRNFKSIKIVENKSTYTLKVILYGGKIGLGIWKASDSFYVSTNSHAIIAQLNSSTGLFYGEGQCARSDMDSMVAEVIDNPTLKITKDFSKDVNWISKKDAGSRKTEIECRTTITDADIVPK